jgi:deoxyadenosine/deoxycytidine kinase
MEPLRIYCVDGNIGAGKSATLDELERRGYKVIKEDLDSWQWCLDKYYTGFDRWAFTLQMAILHSMANQYLRLRNEPASVVFIERSPASGMVFTRNSFRAGSLSLEEFQLVEGFYKLFGWNPHCTFKLDTSIDNCLERVKKRARACEQNLTIHYLHSLDEEYSSEEYTTATTTINVDGRQTPTEIANYILRKISEE